MDRLMGTECSGLTGAVASLGGIPVRYDGERACSSGHCLKHWPLTTRLQSSRTASELARNLALLWCCLWPVLSLRQGIERVHSKTRRDIIRGQVLHWNR
jgi:hypothetical protein